LESKIYSGVKTIEDAKIVTELLMKAYENYTSPEPEISASAFPCKITPPTTPKPTDATKLTPADIDIVCALGDSLTAGFGADATSFLNLFTDYRGSSFSCGAQKTVDQVSTLPALLRLYNPNLQGYSIGNGDAFSTNARLNVAVSGARSIDLSGQVDNLISKLREADPTGDKWKHISLFIGGNDLCDSCKNWPGHTDVIFLANIKQAIDKLLANLKNVFLSLILPPDVTILGELTSGLCSVLRPFECSCATTPETSTLHGRYIDILDKYCTENPGRSPDFKISCQPFLDLIRIPRLPDGKPDMSYFALDCFHFSAKSHAAAGLALWNNLMEQDGQKKREWVVGEPYKCLDPNHPYLR
jgi:phospholipase B1